MRGRQLPVMSLFPRDKTNKSLLPSKLSKRPRGLKTRPIFVLCSLISVANHSDPSRSKFTYILYDNASPFSIAFLGMNLCNP